MTRDDGSVIADWLVLFSAVVLVISLFLPWSSLSAGYVAAANRLQTLQGLNVAPNAWEVYSVVDVLLAALTASFVYVALTGSRRGRFVALIATGIAVAFTVHAVGTPPTSGVPEVLHPIKGGRAASIAPGATPGAGETAAIIALITAVGGLALSLLTDRQRGESEPRRRTSPRPAGGQADPRRQPSGRPANRQPDARRRPAGRPGEREAEMRRRPSGRPAGA